ncbi:MAG: hypothetical protein PVH29_03790 [Candidatus Zixiibacteriota bacterium]|jgi:hypothetical protein
MEGEKARPETGWDERTHRLLDLLEPLSIACLYFMSVISWIYGLVFGIVASTQCKLEANKRVGKICIILALVNFALIALVVVLYVVLIVFMIFGLAWSASPGGTG